MKCEVSVVVGEVKARHDVDEMRRLEGVARRREMFVEVLLCSSIGESLEMNAIEDEICLVMDDRSGVRCCHQRLAACSDEARLPQAIGKLHGKLRKLVACLWCTASDAHCHLSPASSR